MTEWDIETLEDFDGTHFDDGTGWKLVFQIHMGISVRAKITQHPIRIGNFATQVSGLVWTADYEVFGFKDLPTRLRDCYSAIESLLSSNENIRWTETSGRSPEWTIESLIADIGMGEFEPLLRPQAPEPFVWLIAALNRLTHPKIKRPITMQQLSVDPGDPAWGVPSSVYRYWGPDEIVKSDGTGALDWDDLWNGMEYSDSWADETKVNLGFALLWGSSTSGFGGPQTVAVSKTKYISLIAKRDTGEISASNDNWFRYLKPEITQVDYVCALLKVNYTGPHWELTIGTSSPFDTSGIPYGGFVVESAGPDLDFEGTKTVEINLLTDRPVGFPPFTLAAGNYIGNIRVALQAVWVYCDLPEVMGVGELTAPIPVASGEAEWEE